MLQIPPVRDFFAINTIEVKTTVHQSYLNRSFSRHDIKTQRLRLVYNQERINMWPVQERMLISVIFFQKKISFSLY